MATTTVSFTFQNADIAAIQPVLCAWANLPNSPDNAKQAVINWMLSLYQQSLAQASIQTAVQTAQNTATTTAGAVVIT